MKVPRSAGLAADVRRYPNVRSIIVHADAIPGGEREGPIPGTFVDEPVDGSSGEAGHDDDIAGFRCLSHHRCHRRHRWDTPRRWPRFGDMPGIVQRG